MILRALATAALLTATSIAADAQVAAPTDSPAASGSAPANEANSRRICRVSSTIGSRLGGTRTCRTKTEWDQMQREARLTTDHIQRVSPPCMMGPNDPRLGGGPHLVCGSSGP